MGPRRIGSSLGQVQHPMFEAAQILQITPFLHKGVILSKTASWRPNGFILFPELKSLGFIWTVSPDGAACFILPLQVTKTALCTPSRASNPPGICFGKKTGQWRIAPACEAILDGNTTSACLDRANGGGQTYCPQITLIGSSSIKGVVSQNASTQRLSNSPFILHSMFAKKSFDSLDFHKAHAPDSAACL